MTEPLSLVIDTDTASDDAVALLMAARSPHATIRAVTTVAGNVPLPLATRNALVTLELAGAGDVPVYMGRAAPMLRPLETAQYVHGENGMGGVEFPDPRAAAQTEHAVDALRRIVHDEPGRHTLVTLGPLSTIASAILLEPELLTGFAHVYLMAGAFDGVGNVHPVGEFNVWVDPEAAAIVLDAPGERTFIGWDASRRDAMISAEEQAEIGTLGRLGEFVVDINRSVGEFVLRHSGITAFDLPDPIAMAVALDPSIVQKSSRCAVTIGVDPISRGGTFIDHRFEAPAPNCTVAHKVDEHRFKAMLMDACRA
ncbi:MAG: inosine/uridine-preferring nucleoside hydrolase [Ilumatobacteraceae bacterium]|nr:inosine/uridine-preferring nucleoside hydrolase [Ilumatobacteraceae bacterium]